MSAGRHIRPAGPGSDAQRVTRGSGASTPRRARATASVFALVVWPIATLLAAGCAPEGNRAGTADAAAAAPGRQYIVALDLSGSQNEARLAESRRALDRVIRNLSYGDRIVLLRVHQLRAQEDDAQRWADTVPRPRNPSRPTSLDRERLEAVQRAAGAVARAFYDAESAGRLPTTDIFATLHVAAEFMQDAAGRPTTLVLLSDMLQSAHGIEMSRADGVPPPDWIEEHSERGLLPRLVGACVLVVGADATSANGVAVRDFWTRYFAAAGARLHADSYRMIWTGDAPRGCG